MCSENNIKALQQHLAEYQKELQLQTELSNQLVESQNMAVQKKKPKKKSVICGFHIEPFVVEVPKYPPLTVEQLHEWNKIWPLNFHKHILYVVARIYTPSSTKDPTELTDNEVLQMRAFMQEAINQAKIAKQLSSKVTTGVTWLIS